MWGGVAGLATGPSALPAVLSEWKAAGLHDPLLQRFTLSLSGPHNRACPLLCTEIQRQSRDPPRCHAQGMCFAVTRGKGLTRNSLP